MKHSIEQYSDTIKSMMDDCVSGKLSVEKSDELRLIISSVFSYVGVALDLKTQVKKNYETIHEKILKRLQDGESYDGLVISGFNRLQERMIKKSQLSCVFANLIFNDSLDFDFVKRTFEISDQKKWVESILSCKKYAGIGVVVFKLEKIYPDFFRPAPKLVYDDYKQYRRSVDPFGVQMDCDLGYVKTPQHFLQERIYKQQIECDTLPIGSLCALYARRKPNVSWVNECDEYLKNLSRTNQNLVESYTYHGDVVLNTYLRGSRDKAVSMFREYNPPPFKAYLESHKYVLKDLTDDKVEKIIQRLCDKLTEIVTNAPRVSKSVRLVRMEKDDGYHQDVIKNNLYETTSFLSTSIFYGAYNSAFSSMLLIDVDQNTPMLFAGSLSRYRGEYEVLIPPGIAFKVMEKKKLIDDRATSLTRMKFQNI